MSRRVYLLGWGLVLVAGAFQLTDALLRRPGVTAANVRRVQPGMTLEQVEALFGGRGVPMCPRPPVRCLYGWSGDDGLADVVFHCDGERRPLGAQEVQWTPFEQPAAGPLDRVRAWLGW